jgi:hypothetical protein
MYSFEKLYVPANYAELDITQGYSFTTFLTQYHSGNALHLKLKSLMSNRLKKIDVGDLNNASIQYLKWNDEESDFLKAAFHDNLPIISFKTNKAFHSHQLEVLNEFIDENENIISSPEILNQLSDLQHFDKANDYLSNKQLEFSERLKQWDAKNTPIRYTERTIAHLKITNFYALWKNANENYRVSLAHEIGSYIATINGWVYKSNLSKLNNRRVFKALNQLIYLSIDTMHGTFELHDRNGDHCFEINFEGHETEGKNEKHKLKIQG